MTLLTGQPYPTADPWTDLAPLLVNGWGSRGGAPCGFKTDGNDLKISAAFWVGNDAVIASGIPQLAGGPRWFSAFAQSPSASRPLTVKLANGNLFIESNQWDWAQDMGALIIGGEVPR